MRDVSTTFDAYEALADLDAYSLVTRLKAHDGAKMPSFAVHRLVQDFTRRGLEEPKRRQVLEEALGWVDAAFIGNPQDIRDWPELDTLVPHALSSVWCADKFEITEPTARLMNQLGRMLAARSKHSEAEPLFRRALQINEVTLGLNSNTSACLNNLAASLMATNRLAEAEPLMRRAPAIDEASFGPDNPNVARDLSNLAELLRATNRLVEAEPLMQRTLAIDEASYGPDCPVVAIRLNNLAGLLDATNRSAVAEPMFRRSLAITEASCGPYHPDIAKYLNNLWVTPRY